MSLQKIRYGDIDAADPAHRLNFLMDEIIGAEFLHVSDLAQGSGDRKTVLTIGNPPFGKNSSLAVAFFNRAASFSDVIAFIVPRTFCKSSVQDRLDRHFFLVNQWDIPESGFTFEGKAYNVPCVFQVWAHSGFVGSFWERPSIAGPGRLRPLAPRLTETAHFKFVDRTGDPDVAIRRVGVNAGRIFTESPQLCSEQSHLYVSVKSRLSVGDVLQRLRDLDLEHCAAKFDTAGCPSISKNDVCQLYLAALKE